MLIGISSIDIRWASPYPINQLSNFAHHPFILDGVECAGLEGFYHAIKHPSIEYQVAMCQLVGYEAKKAAKDLGNSWQTDQVLHWRGRQYDRHDDEYQHLLDRAFIARSNSNEEFRSALRMTGASTLTHQVGSVDPRWTVITRAEFCYRLMAVRRLIAESDWIDPATRLIAPIMSHPSLQF